MSPPAPVSFQPLPVNTSHPWQSYPTECSGLLTYPTHHRFLVIPVVSSLASLPSSDTLSSPAPLPLSVLPSKPLPGPLTVCLHQNCSSPVGTDCSWAIPLFVQLLSPCLTTFTRMTPSFSYHKPSASRWIPSLPSRGFFVEHGSEPLSAFVGWALHCWCPGRRGRERMVLPLLWDTGAIFAFRFTLGSFGTGNRVPRHPHHMHILPAPCLDSTAPLPRPYLPTAKTVSPIVRFCCMASC